MPEPKPRPTKKCPQCGHEIDVNRGVCTECAYMFPWFKIRLYLGGCGVIFFLFAMAVMAILTLIGPPPVAQ